jgi:hypothetical protein
MRIKNNGIVNGSEKTITISEMQYMQKAADDRSQFFERRMLDELIFNSNNYPEVYNYTSSQGLFPHLGKNYFSGVHLTNGNRYGDALNLQNTWPGLQFYSDPTYACCGF